MLEFDTTEQAMDYVESGFGEQHNADDYSPINGYSPIWESVEIGADVILNDIESKID